MPETYRVAVVGSTKRGNYGHGLDTCWLKVDRTRIVAVADDDKNGRLAAAKRLGLDSGYADYREMLEAAKPDVLAVGPRWIDQHRDMMIAAIDRGVHVYTEKPFCRNLGEAEEILDAARRKHVKVAIAHPTRYSPKQETVSRLLEEGAIGEVLEFRGRGKEDRRGGGEDLWVLGSHVFDTMLALGGKPEWCFARVTKDGEPVTKEDVYDGNEGLGPLAGNGVDAMFGLPGKKVAYFASHQNTAGRPSRYALQIMGSKGVLEILEGTMPPVKYLGDSSWSPGRSGARWQDVSSAGIGKPEPLTEGRYSDRHVLAVEDLLSAIETDGQPKCSAEVGRDIVAMIMAIFESHRIGGPVRFPLETRVNPLSQLA